VNQIDTLLSFGALTAVKARSEKYSAGSVLALMSVYDPELILVDVMSQSVQPVPHRVHWPHRWMVWLAVALVVRDPTQ
jgi:hypothetical protein